MKEYLKYLEEQQEQAKLSNQDNVEVFANYIEEYNEYLEVKKKFEEKYGNIVSKIRAVETALSKKINDGDDEVKISPLLNERETLLNAKYNAMKTIDSKILENNFFACKKMSDLDITLEAMQKAFFDKEELPFRVGYVRGKMEGLELKVNDFPNELIEKHKELEEKQFAKLAEEARKYEIKPDGTIVFEDELDYLREKAAETVDYKEKVEQEEINPIDVTYVDVLGEFKLETSFVENQNARLIKIMSDHAKSIKNKYGSSVAAKDEEALEAFQEYQSDLKQIRKIDKKLGSLDKEKNKEEYEEQEAIRDGLLDKIEGLKKKADSYLKIEELIAKTITLKKMESYIDGLSEKDFDKDYLNKIKKEKAMLQNDVNLMTVKTSRVSKEVLEQFVDGLLKEEIAKGTVLKTLKPNKEQEEKEVDKPEATKVADEPKEKEESKDKKEKEEKVEKEEKEEKILSTKEINQKAKEAEDLANKMKKEGLDEDSKKVYKDKIEAINTLLSKQVEVREKQIKEKPKATVNGTKNAKFDKKYVDLIKRAASNSYNKLLDKLGGKKYQEIDNVVPLEKKEEMVKEEKKETPKLSKEQEELNNVVQKRNKVDAILNESKEFSIHAKDKDTLFKKALNKAKETMNIENKKLDEEDKKANVNKKDPIEEKLDSLGSKIAAQDSKLDKYAMAVKEMQALNMELYSKVQGFEQALYDHPSFDQDVKRLTKRHK